MPHVVIDALGAIFLTPTDKAAISSTSPEPSTAKSPDDGPSVPPAEETSETGPAVPEKPQKKGVMLNVPSRISSQPKADASNSPPLTGATATDESSSTGRGSKRSILGRKKNAKSDPKPAVEGEKTSPTKSEKAAPAQIDGATGVQKKRPSRFLSFLNCCGGTGGRNGVDPDDVSVPPKKSASTATPEKVNSEQEKAAVGTSANATATVQVKDVADEKQAMKDEISNQNPPNPPDKKQKTDSRPLLGRRESSRDKTALATKATNSDSTNPSSTKDNPPPATNATNNTPIVAPLSVHTHNNPQSSSQTPTSSTAQDEQTQRSEWASEVTKLDSDADMSDATADETEAVEHNTADTTLPKVEASNSGLPPPPPLDQRQTQVGVPPVPGTSQDKQIWLLPPIKPQHEGRKCLVLDLDETLVHSSFKILNQADFTIPVEIEGQYHNVYVIKRPGVDAFMKRVGELYEVVVFTASVSKYGDPLLDQLDIHHVVHHRLFRESCYNHQGNYVKVSLSPDDFLPYLTLQDLSQVGRDLRETIIIDNSPTSYIFHPQHAVPISSWFSDAHDNELLDLIPVLEDLAGSQVRDVSLVLDVSL